MFEKFVMFTIVGDETNQWMKLYMFCYEVVFIQIQVIGLKNDI